MVGFVIQISNHNKISLKHVSNSSRGLKPFEGTWYRLFKIFFNFSQSSFCWALVIPSKYKKHYKP
jgi:hypothetical protein|tara:strand:+ start:10 stop:204 length:195 start_codon:yes stop_codon:yes gene_type:complete